MNKENILKGYTDKKYVNVSVSVVLSVVCLVYFLFFPAVLKAEEKYVTSAKKALEELATSGELLKDCLPWKDRLDPEGCDPADKSGQSLKCPTTNYVQGGLTGKCKSSVMSKLEGKLDATALAKLQGSDIDTAEMLAIIYPLDSVAHIHDKCSETPNVCPERYIKRKDWVVFKFAAWCGSSVSVGIEDPNFNAKVDDSEGFLHYFEAYICGMANHDLPLECNPEECTPVEEVDPEPVGEEGTTTGDGTTTTGDGTTTTTGDGDATTTGDGDGIN